MTLYKKYYIIRSVIFKLNELYSREKKGGYTLKESLKRFDIILVNFGNDVIDSEQGGIRPAIIIQNDKGNLHSSTTIVMPLTSSLKNMNQPTHTLLKRDCFNGLKCDSLVLGECLRQISEKRIKKYLGKISSEIEKKEIKRVYDANFGE